MGRDYSSMTVRELEGLRSLVLARLGEVPQFRRGSLQVGYRKCGNPRCRCAQPGEQGHGPRGLWTRSVKGPGGRRGQYIPMDQVDRVRAELDSYAQFETLVEDFVEINEALCRARVGPSSSRREPADLGSDGQKGGSAPGTKR
ncbi:hypothetical protein GCM10027059_50930 [Myceligenerans halotolerans]